MGEFDNSLGINWAKSEIGSTGPKGLGVTGATGGTSARITKGQIIRINIIPNDLKVGDRGNFLSCLNVRVVDFHDCGHIDVEICEEPPIQKPAGSTG